MQIKISIFIITLSLISFSIKSQSLCDTLPFINCNTNEIVINENDLNIHNFITKLKSLKTDKNSSLQIVHIGDSHLQAGFLTEKIKQELFRYFSNDTITSPGFIFPYTVAETNNPFFYKIGYTGNWDWCKNIDQEKTCSLGLSGITIRTKDSIASISIKMQNQKYKYPTKYYFDKIKILHNSSDSIDITINNKIAKPFKGYSFIELKNPTDSIFIEIKQNTNMHFELYGIILENSKSKINYHTIGVNGATAQSYLKCDYFSDHLKLIKPDLIIISLGTNEAYDEDFSQIEHEYILKDLIYQVHDVSPNAAILFISANDHLKNGKITNENIKKVNNNILKICDELNLSYWDFYTIMGGENSIIDWYKKGLTAEDKLHFKKIGYEVQGKLFTKALIDLIEH